MTKSIRQQNILFGIILMVTALVRLIMLDMKPPHFDEGINGWFVTQMWKQGYYRYDPTNFHGPLYFYILQVADLVLGRGIYAMRFVTVLISTAAVWFTLLHARFLGKAAYWAAALLAISPAMVFYGRYAIHESLFILSQVMFSLGFLEWRFKGGKRSIALMVGGLMISIATKETFFIFFGTWLIAWGLMVVSERWFPNVFPPPVKAKKDKKDVVARELVRPAEAAQIWIIGVALLLLVFSGFLMNPHGVVDMIIAFAPWLKTGMGSTGHEKSPLYWLQLMTRYEWAALLTMILIPFAVWKAERWLRFFAATSVGLFLAYSIIPYKTPWCIMGILWPTALTLGLIMQRVANAPRLWMRAGVQLAVAVTFVMAAVHTVHLNYYAYADSSEPYVYVQSTKDLNRVTQNISDRLKTNPEDRNMRIYVFSKDPWPFPWLLDRFPETHYQTLASATDVNADVILADGPDQVALEARFTKKFLRQPLQIRDAYGQGFAYYDFEKFRAILPTGTSVIEPPHAQIKSATSVQNEEAP